jgi:NADPH-dependent curcumin reductase CurA
MDLTKTSANRRTLLQAASAAVGGGILNPFRLTGGAAWAAESLPKKNRTWVYGKPMVNNKITLEQFALQEGPIPEPKDGEALVRVKLVGIHPRVRQSMAEGGSLKIGESEPNFSCAEVLKSRDPAFQEGDIIACQTTWTEYAIVSSKDVSLQSYGPAPETVKELNKTNCQWTYVVRPSIVKTTPPEDIIGLMGTTGLTGYFGMREVGPVMPRDVVACAAITGATGSIAGQLAKIAGATVVGFAGGPEKCKWAVDVVGLDKCIDYRSKNLDAEVRAAFPNGVDVFSDGVAGEVRAAVLKVLNPNSRMINYGFSSYLYGDELKRMRPGQPRTMFDLTEEDHKLFKQRNVKVESWIVHDFYYDRIKAENDLARMVQSGRLKPINTVFEGIEKLPEAIISSFAGNRYGKLSVRFA